MKTILSLIVGAAKEWQKDNAIQKGAAIAFFTTFSVAPLLLIGISVSGVFFGEESVRQGVLLRLGSYVGQDGIAFISSVMEKSFQPVDNFVGILIGFFVLLFGAAGVFFQVREALSRMYQDEIEYKGMVNQIFRGVILPILFVFGSSLVFIVMSLFRMVLTIVANYMSEFVNFDLSYLFVINYSFSLLVMVGVFMVVYRILSPVMVKWKNVFWGALVSAVLIQISSFFVNFYISIAGVSVIYGTAGSLVVLMFWIFFAAMIFLYGAEITKVLHLKEKNGFHKDRS